MYKIIFTGCQELKYISALRKQEIAPPYITASFFLQSELLLLLTLIFK